MVNNISVNKVNGISFSKAINQSAKNISETVGRVVNSAAKRVNREVAMEEIDLSSGNIDSTGVTNGNETTRIYSDYHKLYNEFLDKYKQETKSEVDTYKNNINNADAEIEKLQRERNSKVGDIKEIDLLIKNLERKKEAWNNEIERINKENEGRANLEVAKIEYDEKWVDILGDSKLAFEKWEEMLPMQTELLRVSVYARRAYLLESGIIDEANFPVSASFTDKDGNRKTIEFYDNMTTVREDIDSYVCAGTGEGYSVIKDGNGNYVLMYNNERVECTNLDITTFDDIYNKDDYSEYINNYGNYYNQEMQPNLLDGYNAAHKNGSNLTLQEVNNDLGMIEDIFSFDAEWDSEYSTLAKRSITDDGSYFYGFAAGNSEILKYFQDNQPNNTSLKIEPMLTNDEVYKYFMKNLDEDTRKYYIYLYKTKGEDVAYKYLSDLKMITQKDQRDAENLNYAFENYQKSIYYKSLVNNEDFDEVVNGFDFNSVLKFLFSGIIGQTIMFNEWKDFEQYSNVLTEEEKNILCYLYRTNPEEAKEYFKWKENELNQRLGQQEAYDFLKDYLYLVEVDENALTSDAVYFVDTDENGNPVYYEAVGLKLDNDAEKLKLLASLGIEGFGDGVTSFSDGLENAALAVFNSLSDSQSASQYKQMYILQILAYADDTLGKGFYQVGSSIGNMAIPMGVGAVCNFFLPGSGEVASSLLMGISSGGNAALEAHLQGANYFQALFYGTLNGASEATIERFIGGIPVLSNLDRFSEMSGLKGLVAKMVSEGNEEMIQSILDPFIQTLAFGTPPEQIDWEEVLVSGIYGAITAGTLNGGSLALGTVTSYISTLSPSMQAKIRADLKAKGVDIDNPNAGQTNVAAMQNRVTEANGYQLDIDDFGGWFRHQIETGFFNGEQVNNMLNGINQRGYLSENTGTYLRSIVDSGNDIYVKTVNSTDVNSIMAEGVRCLGSSTSGSSMTPATVSAISLDNTITGVDGMYDLVHTVKSAFGVSQGMNPIDGTIVLSIPKGLSKEQILYFNNDSGCYCIKPEYISCFIGTDQNGVVSNPTFNDNFYLANTPKEGIHFEAQDGFSGPANDGMTNVSENTIGTSPDITNALNNVMNKLGNAAGRRALLMYAANGNIRHIPEEFRGIFESLNIGKNDINTYLEVDGPMDIGIQYFGNGSSATKRDVMAKIWQGMNAMDEKYNYDERHNSLQALYGYLTGKEKATILSSAGNFRNLILELNQQNRALLIECFNEIARGRGQGNLVIEEVNTATRYTPNSKTGVAAQPGLNDKMARYNLLKKIQNSPSYRIYLNDSGYGYATMLADPETGIPYNTVASEIASLEAEFADIPNNNMMAQNGNVTTKRNRVTEANGYQLDIDDFGGWHKHQIEIGFVNSTQVNGALNGINQRGYLSENTGTYLRSIVDSGNDIYVKTVNSKGVNSIMSEGVRCLGNSTSLGSPAPKTAASIVLSDVITKVDGMYDLVHTVKSAFGVSQGMNPIDGTIVLSIPKGLSKEQILYFNSDSGCYCIKPEYISCFIGTDQNGVVSEPTFNDNFYLANTPKEGIHFEAQDGFSGIATDGIVNGATVQNEVGTISNNANVGVKVDGFDTGSVNVKTSTITTANINDKIARYNLLKKIQNSFSYQMYLVNPSNLTTKTDFETGISYATVASEIASLEVEFANADSTVIENLNYSETLPEPIKKCFLDVISKKYDLFFSSSGSSMYGADQNATAKYAEAVIKNLDWITDENDFISYFINKWEYKQETAQELLSILKKTIGSSSSVRFRAKATGKFVEYVIDKCSRENRYDVLDIVNNSFEFRPSSEFSRLSSKLVSLGMSDFEATRTLCALDSTGICSYAAVANSILLSYRDNPAAFERDFGYPMYVEIDGKQELNSSELLLDMYTYINSNKYQSSKVDNNLFRFDSDGSLHINKLVTSNQVYLSGFVFQNMVAINSFLHSKNSGLNFKIDGFNRYSGEGSKTAPFSVDGMKELIINYLKQGQCNSVNLGLFLTKDASSGNIIPLRFLESPDKVIKTTATWNEGGGHAVCLTGVVDDYFVVSSWGKRLLIPIEDIVKSKFNIVFNSLEGIR